MVSVTERLRAKAALRTKEVVIDGDSFLVREIGADAFARYGELAKTDRGAATAGMLMACVVDENGLPALTKDDAHEVVLSARVTMPLVQAIMELSGFGAEEKKADAG